MYRFVPPFADYFSNILAPIRIKENRKLCNLGRFMHNQFSSIRYTFDFICTTCIRVQQQHFISLWCYFTCNLFFFVSLIGIASSFFFHVSFYLFFGLKMSNKLLIGHNIHRIRAIIIEEKNMCA